MMNKTQEPAGEVLGAASGSLYACPKCGHKYGNWSATNKKCSVCEKYMNFQMTINGTKSTPGPWEYYREEMSAGEVKLFFATVRQKGGRNIVRLHNEADAQMIALTPDALESIAIALGELEKIRSEKLAVRELADEANAVSAARVALQRVLHSANKPISEPHEI